MRTFLKICWICLALAASIAYAKPLAGVDAEGVRIVFTDEPCALKEVTNLPYAATWTEKGKVTQGCWAFHPQARVVMTYWADRTVAIIPPQALHPFTEAAL